MSKTMQLLPSNYSAQRGEAEFWYHFPLVSARRCIREAVPWGQLESNSRPIISPFARISGSWPIGLKQQTMFIGKITAQASVFNIAKLRSESILSTLTKWRALHISLGLKPMSLHSFLKGMNSIDKNKERRKINSVMLKLYVGTSMSVQLRSSAEVARELERGAAVTRTHKFR